MTPLDTINQHLAAIADLARQQQREIERLSAPPTPPASPTHRRGVVIWFDDDPAVFARPLRELGITAVRGWVSIGGPGVSLTRDEARIARWADAGFDVIACLAPAPESRLYWTPTALDELATHLAGTRAAWLELGNEPDLPAYWPVGDWRGFLVRFAAPLAERLKKLGCRAKLLRPALGHIAKQLDYLPQYAAAAKAVPADGQAVHPYGNSAGDIARRLDAWREACAGMPLVATEWNLKTDAAGWRKHLPAAMAALAGRTSIACYYRVRDRDPATTGGTGGSDDYALLDAQGRVTEYGRAYGGHQ